MDETVGRYLAGRGIEVEPPPEGDGESYREWFRRRVLGLDPEGYRRAFWREVSATGRSIGPVPRTLDDLLREHCLHGAAEPGALLLVCAAACGIFPAWLAARSVERLAARLRRRSYYPRELERRHRLADARRAVTVRRTPNPRPSLEAVRAAHAAVRARRPAAGETPALAALRLGALLEDLERYVDNHVLASRGVRGARGRAGGIKRLLEREAPDLFARYGALMRCKALAKRYRQACGADPDVPVDALLPAARPADGAPAPETRSAGGRAFPLYPHLRDAASMTAWMRARGNAAYLRSQDWAPRSARTYREGDVLRDAHFAAAAEVLGFGGDGSTVALEAAVALRIDPECIPREGAPCVPCTEAPRGVRASGRVRRWLARLRAASAGRPSSD